jgi:HAAS
MTYNPEPEIKHYLKRLSKAARDLPRARRRELVSEIEQHIRETLIETPVESQAEMLTLLDRLGAPEEIAAAASGQPEAIRSTTMETWAIILLLLGGFVFLVGWLAGVVLLWSSNLWTRRDKIIGTLVIPGGLATGFFVFLLLSALGGGQVCGSSGPVYRIDKNGSKHLVQAATHTTCHGGTSTAGTVGLLIALVIVLIAPIVTAIYLGRRLNKQKYTRLGDASTAIG